MTAALAAAMLALLSDPLIVRQEIEFHYSGTVGAEDHEAHVAVMEKLLGRELPEWDPEREIPDAFLAVAGGRPPLKRRKIRPYRGNAPVGARLCELSDERFDSELSLWHDFVLEDMSGAADSEESAAAPIAWLWHKRLAGLRKLRRACPR